MRNVTIGLLVLAGLSIATAVSAVDLLVRPDAEVMRLDEIGLYEIGYQRRGESPRSLPVGWSGYFEEASGVACMPAGEIDGKEAFLLHPPWNHGVGATYQRFTVGLPKAAKIVLRGAFAMRPDGSDQSDGVTFRIYINSTKTLDEHRKETTWRPFEVDLSHLAGKTATIRFESDCGPKNNAGWDFALWGNRQIVAVGYTPKPVTHPNPPPLRMSRMLSARNGSVAPPDGFSGRRTASLRDGRAVFTYSGPDGSLRYTWLKPASARSPVLGTLSLRAEMTGDKPSVVSLASQARIGWTKPVEFVSSKWKQTAGTITCEVTYRAGREAATLTVAGRMAGKSLLLDIDCDKSWISVLDAGTWGPLARKRNIPVPFYSGSVQYLPHENLFSNAFLDWTHSSAASHDGTRANYPALTDGSRNRLRERAIYNAAWHLAETLPNVPNPPSPYIGKIAGKIVLDSWGGSFTDIATNLRNLADYGISNCIALIHVWQRSGYDNALPAHVPAAAGLGGDEGMATLVHTGTQLGYHMALHENYADYYPNYDHYEESEIALDSAGNKINAWYNPGTKIQSFAVKPNAMLRLAATQSPLIHERYGTNADYLDVHSAVPPWFHVDCRAGEQGAGTFERVWDVHRKLWQYERDVHDGPVFGEGNNHWYWSGCLDGVEAQFGSGWAWGQGERAPLMVDFDLLKVHPLQLNHGMGYYERWGNDLRWGGRPPMVALDQYRMQEVIYGHAGFLGAGTWSVIPVAWLEHHLLSPVNARCASAAPVDISYEVEGRWVDGTAAAKAGVWKRARVRYANGLTITANDAETPMRVGKRVLPRFGWLAEGAGVTAYTALVDGTIVDYATTADSVFANARNAAHWNYTGMSGVQPSVAGYKQTADREFEITYQWQVPDRLPKDYNCFVHFMGRNSTSPDSDGICFQGDHRLALPTSKWKVGDTVADGPHRVRIPDDIADGDYRVTIGLFESVGGVRIPLAGVSDGESRIRLGMLRVSESGATIEFQTETAAGNDRQALYSHNLNTLAKTVDFGTLRTNGSVLIRRYADEWSLIAMPRNEPFDIELNEAAFGSPASARSIGGSSEHVEVLSGNGWWRLQMNGAKEYRWKTR